MTENEILKKRLALLMLPVMLLVGEGLALLMVMPVQSTGVTAFQDPQSLGNPLVFLAIILVFTFIMLMLIKFRLNFIISAIIAFSVFFTFSFVALTLLSLFFGATDAVALASLGVAFAVTALLYYYPEWYVIDTAGILLVAGVGALFGTSIGITPAIILLVIMAVYDAVSVYGTKHMLNLAQGVVNLKLPTILFIVPKKRDFSYRNLGVTGGLDIKGENQGENPGEKKERDAYILGAGDIIIPSILVVSARVFQPYLVPVIGAVFGSLAGMLLLVSVLDSGKPQAGLPPLNSGTIIGFLIGCAIVGSWGWI
jgi:presenilin-like A22 family membrane protease